MDPAAPGIPLLGVGAPTAYRKNQLLVGEGVSGQRWWNECLPTSLLEVLRGTTRIESKAISSSQLYFPGQTTSSSLHRREIMALGVVTQMRSTRGQPKKKIRQHRPLFVLGTYPKRQDMLPEMG